jgi:hypothetical protein
LQKSVFNQSRHNSPPLRVARDGVQSFPILMSQHRFPPIHFQILPSPVQYLPI